MEDRPAGRPVRRRRKKQSKKLNKKLILIGIAAVAAAVLIGVICAFVFGGEEAPKEHDPDRGPLKELTVGESTRRGETTVVDTSYLTVEYPYAFSDLIRVKAINQEEQTALSFCGFINGEEQELYTLWFNGSDGQTVGSFDLEDGKKPVVVTLAFYTPSAQLQGDDRTTFFAVQETVNDVIASMKKDPQFTSYE